MPMTKILPFLALLLSITGCVDSPPLISHAHVGHALISWHDTPGQQGLFIITQQEADTALQQSELALAEQNRPQKVRWHLTSALYALNPDLLPEVEGKQTYGVIRSLEGAIDHLEFAATSDDASLNLVSKASAIVEQGVALVEQFKAAAETAQYVQTASDQELTAIASQLNSQLKVAINGNGRNSNSPQAYSSGVTSLSQLNWHIQKMLTAEKDPAYQPISRRYLLGLVRVESGEWVYDLERSSAGYSYSGY